LPPLAKSALNKALTSARTGEVRTRTWLLPNTEAKGGLALALVARGETRQALDVLRPVALGAKNTGHVAETTRIQFLEAKALADELDSEVEAVIRLLREQPRDPRLDTSLEAILALIDHRSGRCDNNCGSRCLELADAWAGRGARLAPVTATVMLAPALFQHKRSDATQRVVDAVRTASELGFLPFVQPWLRALTDQADEIAQVGGYRILGDLVSVDPTGWIPKLPHIKLDELTPDGLDDLVAAIERRANRETPRVLEELPEVDFGSLRQRLAQRHATRYFVRTLGSLELRKGGWKGSPLRMRRRRTRALLGLLAAHATSPVSRDMVLDVLWPESDPAAAVNNLNQTLFQLRREIDPHYRNGRSPEYIISTSDWLELNPALIRMDWVEILRHAALLSEGDRAGGDFARFVSEVAEGEFLIDARYEDWASSHRQRVHEALREAILPVAQDITQAAQDRVRLARAAISIDPYDELAHVALARALSDSGRRTAALALLRDFARRLADEFDETPSPAFESASVQLGNGQSLLDSDRTNTKTS